MSEIAAGYVSIIPKFSGGFRKGIEAELGGAGVSGGKSMGRSLRDSTLAVFGGNVLTAAVGKIAGTMSSALGGGFDRLMNIEQARIKLKTLGMDVDKAMASVSTAVDGTKFAISDAADMSANLGAAGVKAGDEMTKWLSRTADAAQFTNRPFSDMQQVLQKVVAEGRVTGDTFQEFPLAAAALADHLGISQAAVRKLASEGKITADQLGAALDKKIGGAAKNAGGSFLSMRDNLKTALNATMANLIEPFTKAAMPIMDSLLGMAKGARDAMKPIGEQFSAWLQPRAEAFGKTLQRLPEILGRLKASASQSLAPLLAAFKGAGPQMKTVGANLASAFKDALPVIGNLAKSALPVLVGAFKALPPILVAVSGALAKVMAFMKDNPALVGALATGILSAVAAFKALSGIAAVAGTLSTVAKATEGVSTGFKALQVVGNFKSIIGSIKTIGLAMKAAFLANPVGLIIVGVIALVAAFIYAYKHSEKFRNIVNKAVNGVKTVALAVANWFKGPFVNFFTGAWSKITAGFSAVKNFFSNGWSAISGAAKGGAAKLGSIWETVKAANLAAARAVLSGLSAIKAGFSAAWDGVKAATSLVWETIKQVVGGALQGLSAIITGYITVVTSIFSGLWESVKAIFAAAWLALVAIFTGNWSQLPIIFGALLNRLSAIWSGVWETVKGAGIAVWNGILAGLNQIWTALVNAITTAMSAVRNGVAFAWNAIWSTVKSVNLAIGQAVLSAWNGVKSAISSAVSTVQGAVSSAWNTIASTVRSKSLAMGQSVLSAMASVKSAISSGMSQASAAVSSGITGVVSFFTGLPGRIKGAVGGMGSLLFSVGQDLLRGLMRGIDSMASAAMGKIRDLGNKITSAAKNALQIHSPSRLWDREIGRQLPAGAIQGIEKGTPALVRAAQAAANAAIPTDVPTWTPGLAAGAAVALGGSGSQQVALYDSNGQLMSYLTLALQKMQRGQDLQARLVGVN